LEGTAGIKEFANVQPSSIDAGYESYWTAYSIVDTLALFSTRMTRSGQKMQDSAMYS